MKTQLIITLLLSLYSFPTMAQETTKNPYPDDVINSYMANCKERSVTEGVPLEDAETLCTCTINKFQAQYTLEEFKQLISDSEQNPEAADTLSEVGYTCFDEILYEDEATNTGS